MNARDKFIVLAAIALVAVSTAVAVVGYATGGEAAAALGGTYAEAVVGQPRSLDPVLAATPVDRDLAALVFSGLTRFDQKGSVVPDLASGVNVSEDGKTWTFTLRSDARWHDGAPVTADDVVYTVGVIQDEDYHGPYAGSFAGATVEKVDAHTVRFTLADVYAPFGEATTVPLLPVHRLNGVRAADLPANDFGLHPIGTGPFRFESRDEQRVVLVRNDDFYRTGPERHRPYLDRFVLRLYPDAAAALQALARGEVQGYGGLPAADADRARHLRDLAAYYLPADEETALFLDLAPNVPLFRDRVVRQAIATAINKPRILQLAADGHGAVADEPVPTWSWAYDRDVRKYAYAPGDARAMLDAADWIDHDGDGVRDKANVALKFTLVVNDDPPRVAAAGQIARDLDAIGIGVTVAVVSFEELVGTRAKGRSFEAMVLAVSAGLDPDPYAFWHSSQTKDPGHNYTGYSVLAVDRALEAGRRTLDQGKRRELYAQVFEQLAEDVPAVYLYFADYVYAIDRSVKGFRIAPVSDPSDRFWNVEDWYVRTQAQR